MLGEAGFQDPEPAGDLGAIQPLHRGPHGVHMGLGRAFDAEGDRTRFLGLDRVEAIEATGNDMHLYERRTSHMLRETLASLESRLGDRFLRVHRSWMVAPEHVQELRGGTLVLHSGLEVPVSRGFRAAVQARLNGMA